MISPTSGHVISSAPLLPSTRKHRISTYRVSIFSRNGNVNVLLGACCVGRNGTGSQSTSMIRCMGSNFVITHSGHMN